MITQEAREKAIDDAVLAHTDEQEPETLRIPWQDDQHPPGHQARRPPRVLNPHSHRIRAQLEDHPQRELIESDPFSDAAQEAIAGILRATAGFKDLKDNLAEEGQRDPGVITRDGVLVNANTRCVALRDLASDSYLRAAVLPKGAKQADIDKLELRLQMQRDYKQEYSFTNELLFVDDLITEYSYSAEDASRELGWATSSEPKALKAGREKVEQYQRMLALIRRVQQRSGAKLPITFFDEEKKQALIDLDDRTRAMRKKGMDAEVEMLEEARLLGIVVDVDYRDLRHITETAASEQLLVALEDNSVAKKAVPLVTARVIQESRPVTRRFWGTRMMLMIRRPEKARKRAGSRLSPRRASQRSSTSSSRATVMTRSSYLPRTVGRRRYPASR